jgi:hypothetical protein
MRCQGAEVVGKGIDLARADAPEHCALLDDFKDQLMIAFVKRLGRNVSIPVKEVDETGRYTLSFNIENGAFNFQLREKQ